MRMSEQMSEWPSISVWILGCSGPQWDRNRRGTGLGEVGSCDRRELKHGVTVLLPRAVTVGTMTLMETLTFYSGIIHGYREKYKWLRCLFGSKSEFT